MIYKKIMLAIDESDTSLAAIHEVLKLTEGQHVHLRLVYAVDETFSYHGGPGFDYSLIIKAFKDEGQKFLDSAASIVASQPSLKVETTLLELKPFQGRIAEVIVEAAKEWAADLLVIGTHGRRGFSHFFLGSVAENIIRIATVPVLLVRASAG